MLIFYTAVKNKSSLVPVVVIDSLCSDDRFSTTEIQKAVWLNAPDDSSLKTPAVYSCEYSCQFEHVGIPIGAALKSAFSASIKSPSAELILAFAPTFNNSANSISQMSDPNFKVPNVKTNITYAAMVIKTTSGTISRKFIVYAAPIFPDPYGTLVTMVLQGAMVDDILIKGAVSVQINKKTSFKAQMDKFLSGLKPKMTANYNYMSHANDKPATEKLFPPMKLNNLLSEICLQNNLIYTIDYSKNVVNFYGAGQASAPKPTNDYIVPKFSFLGSTGYMAWGLGVENYANIKFKSVIFDCKLFNKITIYNDIKSAFFGGLTKNPAPVSASILKKTPDSYDAWIIRYAMRWSRYESICEITASNNWVMSQFRIDGLMETAIYEASGLL